MRALLLIAVALAACTGDGVHGTSARLEVPGRLELPRAFVGGEAKAVLELRSTGTAWITIASISSDSALELGAPAAPFGLPPGGTIPVHVTWHPAAAGALDATVTVVADVGSASIRVTGEAREPPPCNDANPCTDDVFDAVRGYCVHTAREGTCDDGSACTTGDTCQDGICRGAAVTCDDHDPCTSDLCDDAKGCVFPADPTHCDDGDACTADVCDPGGACRHGPAPDGTQCGPFSCALTHVCTQGTCHELDVTGLSDDLPCDDGNACTSGDRCVAGACEPLEKRVQEASVEATFETWGGADSRVATDGTNYVFTDPQRTLVLTRTSDGRLALAGSLSEGSDLPPVPYGRGFFALVSRGRFVVLDLGDPATPHVSWEVALADVAGPGMHAVHLAVASPFAILALTDGTKTAIVAVAPPLPFKPAASVQLDQVAGSVFDLDAEGREVAWVGDAGGRWLELDEDANVLRSEPIRGTVSLPRRVSVQNHRVALLAGDRLEIREVAPVASEPIPCAPDGVTCSYVVPTACDASAPTVLPEHLQLCDDAHPCTGDARCESIAAYRPSYALPDCEGACCERVSICMTPGTPLLARGFVSASPVDDLVLDGDSLFWSGPTGIFGQRLDTPDSAAIPGPSQIDPLAASRLDRGPDHLLASGAIALPLQRLAPLHTGTPQIPVPPSHVRVTGPGHGDLSAAVDVDADHLALAGPVALGRLNLQSRNISGWNILSTASSSGHPRILSGTTRAATIEPAASSLPGRTDPACFGAMPELLQPSGQLFPLAFCGIQAASLHVSGKRLYTYGSAGPQAPPVVTGALRTWNLESAGSRPEREHIFTGERYVRAEPLTQRVAVVTVPPPPGSDFAVALYGGASVEGAPALSSTITVGGHLDGDLEFGTDGNSLVSAEFETIELFDLAAGGRAIASVPFNSSRVGPRMFSMSGGHAWVGGPDLPLTQVAYAPRSLSVAAELDLGEVEAVADFGERAIVFGKSKVSVVRSACR